MASQPVVVFVSRMEIELTFVNSCAASVKHLMTF